MATAWWLYYRWDNFSNVNIVNPSEVAYGELTKILVIPDSPWARAFNLPLSEHRGSPSQQQSFLRFSK